MIMTWSCHHDMIMSSWSWHDHVIMIMTWSCHHDHDMIVSSWSWHDHVIMIITWSCHHDHDMIMSSWSWHDHVIMNMTWSCHHDHDDLELTTNHIERHLCEFPAYPLELSFLGSYYGSIHVDWFPGLGVRPFVNLGVMVLCWLGNLMASIAT